MKAKNLPAEKPVHYVVVRPKIVEEVIYSGMSGQAARDAWQYGMVCGSGATREEALATARDKMKKDATLRLMDSIP